MIFFLLLNLSLSPLFAFDELQDSNFEKRINSIYKTHYSNLVSDQEWSTFISKVEDNEYTVRGGDTLWDLSRVFFADGLYWSKLWSVNEEITNPHLIYVGAKVRFFSGSMASPPGIEVSGADKMAEGIATQEPEGEPPPPGMKPVDSTKAKDAIAKKLYPGAPSIPPPKDFVKPVPNSLPSTFKAKADSKNRYDKQGLSFDVRPPLILSPRFIPHSFLFPGLFSSYPNTGKVTEVEDGEEIAGKSQYVYIDSDKNYSIGDQFTIIGKDFSFQKGLTVGDVIQYRGVAKVIDDLGDSRYRAEVIYAINPILVGSWVSEEAIPNLADDNVGRPKNVRAELIGGAYAERRDIFATGDIVFLDSGSSDGLSQGDILGVYKNRSRRYSNSKVSESPRPIGHLKVFRADTSVASAFVFQASEAIVIGDKTGTATLTSTQSSESEQLDLDSIEGELDFDEGSAAQADEDEESLESELESETL